MEIEKNFSEENEAGKSACSNRQDQRISITPLGDANLYFSPLSKFLPENLIKLRIESKFFELHCEPFNRVGRYTFNLGGQVEINLRELRDILKVLKLLTSLPNGMLLQIDQGTLPPLNAKITLNDKMEDWSKPYQISEKAISICQTFSINEKNIVASIKNLLGHSESIEHFYAVTIEKTASLLVDFSSDTELRTDTNTACIFFLNTVIGNHIVSVPLAVVGFLFKKDDGSYKMVTTESRTSRPLIILNKDEFEVKNIQKELDAFAAQLESEGIQIVKIVS